MTGFGFSLARAALGEESDYWLYVFLRDGGWAGKKIFLLWDAVFFSAGTLEI